ncbi:putative Holliday junction resolvase [compost metagenome]
MSHKRSFLCLDVGEKRIGTAVGDDSIRLAVPFETIEVDGSEVKEIARLAVTESADAIIVGYPRNQSGETTAQTAYVEDFARQLTDIAEVIFQDESLTSVIAEERLKSYKKPYSKGDIDAQAAAIILQDYLEQLA